MVFWLGVIFAESTPFASSTNSFGLLFHLCRWLHLPIDIRLLSEVNHLLRKSGHFLGYAILSILTFYALRNTYRDRLRSHAGREWGMVLSDRWRPAWALCALLLSLATASADEFHQTFLPSRTGRWQDVVIDTSGALIAQFVLFLLALWTAERRQAIAELSLKR